MVAFSVLIITHGREELLWKCLDSLRSSPLEWQLILISNGESLSEKINEFSHQLTKHVTLIEMPERITPGKARNIGLGAAEGEWIFFIDDDAYLSSHYFDIILPLLHKATIDVLGGPDAPAQGMNSFSQALAIALSSPFCTGVTFSRHRGIGNKLISAKEEILTSCNLWVRKSIMEDHSFPEDFLRAEETSFLLSLTQKGARMFYHPLLKVFHYRRKNLKDLWRPTFYAGFYRSKIMQDKTKESGKSFWLPSVFVLLHLLAFVDMAFFLALAKVYLISVTAISYSSCYRSGKFSLTPLVVFLHYYIVCVYGIGFLYQRYKFWK